MNKKTLIIIISIALLAGLITTVIFVLKSSSIQKPAPSVGGGVSDKFLYYFSDLDNSFYRTTQNENQKVISITYTPAEVSFSANNTKALIIGSLQDLSRPIDLVDLNKLQLFTLDPRILNASLSPDGQNIAYHYFDEQAAVNELRYSDLQHSKIKTLQDIGMSDTSEYFELYSLEFISNTEVVTFPVFRDISDVDLTLFNTSGNSSSVLTTAPIIDLIASPHGQKVALVLAGNVGSADLESSLEKINEGIIWFMDMSGNKTPTNIKASANHIAWSTNSDKLYVIVKYPSDENALLEVYPDGRTNTIANDLQIGGIVTQISVTKDDKNLIIVTDGNVSNINLNSTTN